MNREILKVIGRECVWYSLVCGISFISATALFLILESFGFDNTLDSPTDIFYGLPPIFFNASLLGSDLALLFIVLLRTDLDSLNIRKWKSERPNLSFFKYLGIGVGAAFLVIGFDSFEIVTLSAFFGEAELYSSYWNETKNFGFGEKLFLLVSMGILAPIVEELYFREVMLGSIHRSGFPNFAMFFSCAAFSIIHFDFLHIFAYLFSSVIFSILYIETRSIIPSITAHACLNLFSFYTLHFLTN